MVDVPSPEEAVAKAAAPDPRKATVDRLNKDYALVNDAGAVRIWQEQRNPITGRYSYLKIRDADMRVLLANDLVKVGEKEDGTSVWEPAYTIWRASPDRLDYKRGTSFDPSGAEEPGILNLWRGFGVVPGPGDWSLMREHLEHVICASTTSYYDYLLNLLAWWLQHPANQGEVCIVLIGKEGCGKGFVGRCLLKLLGQHGHHLTNAQHVTGSFNGQLRDVVMLFVDEAFFAGNAQAANLLRAYITEPTIPINDKGVPVYTVPNFMHMVMASNHEWVVPASLDDRRFFVLNCADTRKGDLPYFKALEAQMQNGGYAAMLYDLLHRDVSNFEHRRVPQTEGLAEQKKRSMAEEYKWWEAVLHRGYLYKSKFGHASTLQKWRDFATSELMYASYQQFISEGPRVWHPLSAEYLGRAAVQMGCVGGKRLKVGAILGESANSVTTADTRKWGYFLGSLTVARKLFCEKIGVAIDWGEGVVDEAAEAAEDAEAAQIAAEEAKRPVNLSDLRKPPASPANGAGAEEAVQVPPGLAGLLAGLRAGGGNGS